MKLRLRERVFKRDKSRIYKGVEKVFEKRIRKKKEIN